MKSTSKSAEAFFQAHRPKVTTLSLTQASLQIFKDFQSLFFKQIKYSTKLLKLQESLPTFAPYVADIGKHFLSSLQLPTGDPVARSFAEETKAKTLVLLQSTRESARDLEIEFYENCINATSVALQAYSLQSTLATLLREKTSCIPDANIVPESLFLFNTINAWVEKEKEKHLKAAAPMEVVAEQASSAAILAELKLLREKLSFFEKAQKNEPSRSNLPHQSPKPKSRTSPAPPAKQQQQKSRGRSPTPKRGESRGRSSSAPSTDRRAQGSGKSNPGRSTSPSRLPSRSSR